MHKHPILKIIIKNTFTLFNLVNLILALMVAWTGSFKNLLFIFIALANTLISIVNEVRAYKIVAKMRLLTEQKPNVERDGKIYHLPKTEIKVGDIILLGLGDQVSFDSTLISGSLEVNESFVTGEQDSIKKGIGDSLISGSFIVSGSAKAKVEHIGADNFINKIELSASNIKTADSKLFTIMNNIVKYISYALIPIGALLLWSRLNLEPTNSAIISTVAALINMIPEGLILLTSSVLALSTIRLSKKRILVQDLYSIETLARVDCIALDKTGTLTTGKMSVKDSIAFEKSFETVLASLLSHQTSENATTSALKKKFLKRAKFDEIEGIVDIIPFSSERKYSGIKTETATYLMGAVEFITDDAEIIKKAHSYAGNYRVLAVVRVDGVAPSNASSEAVRLGLAARSAAEEEALLGANNRADACREQAKVSRVLGVNDDREPSTLRNDTSFTLLGIVCLEDEIRSDAKDIIDYFYKNNIAPKIISGDDLETVKTIAERVGVKDLRVVNLSDIKNKNYDKLVKEYSIFTRVKPSEKKSLILALKRQGNTVAMTGDGVNDILAMKEADCSIAIGDGSDAARRSAKLVLLNSDFSAIPSIIDEGRQSINNLERSTVLFLTKTVYAAILAVIFILLPLKYPFMPISMSLLNVLCIGMPGFVLALERNTERIKNQFVSNIKKFSLPTGIIISLAIILISILDSTVLPMNQNLSLIAVVATFTLDFILLYRISRPLNKFRTALLLTILAIFLLALLLPLSRTFFFAQ